METLEIRVLTESEKHAGWWEDNQLLDGEFTKSGRMICDKCYFDIKNEKYFRIHVGNIYHRGNEQDQVNIFHTQCFDMNDNFFKA